MNKTKKGNAQIGTTALRMAAYLEDQSKRANVDIRTVSTKLADNVNNLNDLFDDDTVNGFFEKAEEYASHFGEPYTSKWQNKRYEVIELTAKLLTEKYLKR